MYLPLEALYCWEDCSEEVTDQGHIVALKYVVLKLANAE